MKKQGKFIGPAALTLALGSVLIIGNALFATGAAVADVGSGAKTEAVEQSIVLSSNTNANGVSPVIETLPDGTTVITQNGSGGIVFTYDGEGFSTSAYDPSSSYAVGQPGEGDIAQEAAVSIAVNSITERYALKQAVLDRFNITATYYTTYSDISGAAWVVELNPISASDFSEIGCYTAVLNAETGKVLQLRSAADGLG